MTTHQHAAALVRELPECVAIERSGARLHEPARTLAHGEAAASDDREIEVSAGMAKRTLFGIDPAPRDDAAAG